MADAFDPGVEVEASRGGLEARDDVDEKRCVVDGVFRAATSMEPESDLDWEGLKKPYMQVLGGSGGDHDGKPAPPIIHVDNGFVDGDLGRRRFARRIDTGLLHLETDVGSTPVHTKGLKLSPYI